MSQVKIYALRSVLDPVKSRMSDVIHACVMEALQYPADKRVHRFFPMESGDFFMPAGRTVRYTIIEISMFEGRSIEAKKQLIHLLFARFESELAIAPQDVEITISETPRHNWGFRGKCGDEHELSYRVEV
jgi:phenylpyruvate tautomerase PptA (4-oxalocrotonate tautomerase family)